MEIPKAVLQGLVQVGWSVNGMSSLVSSNPSYIDKSTVVIMTSIARGRPRSWAKWSATTVGVTGTFLTVTDFGGLDVGIPQAMRRSIDFAANSRGTGAG